MWPRTNFNLVTVPPESGSLVTQVDIWGGQMAKWATHVMSAHILVPVRRVKYIVDPGTKFWSMALQDDLQCPLGERKISAPFRGILVGAGSSCYRQKGWLLLGGPGKLRLLRACAGSFGRVEVGAIQAGQ